MTNETWKFTTLSEHYEVSNLGRVRSWINSHGLRRKEPRIVKPRLSSTGYFIVDLRRRSIAIHRLVATAFLDKPLPGFQVNHKNGIRTDNSLDNLEWVTVKENVAHGYRIGSNQYRGERQKFSKLKNDQVLKLIDRLENGDSIAAIAKEYGISTATINAIKRGITWSWLTGIKKEARAIVEEMTK